MKAHHTRSVWTSLAVLAGGLVVGACSDRPLADHAHDPLGPSPIGFAGTPQTVTTDFQMPVLAAVSATTSGCSNAPGPWITLDGQLALGGLGVELIFRNNQKGTHEHTEESAVDVVVVPVGESVTIPKQPVEGGVGGNPYIWIQFVDGNGAALTDEIFLGRCVQGFFDVSADFSSLASALANVTVEECSNSPGPVISLDGEMRVASGVDARIIFRNSDNPVGGPHEAEEETDVRIVIVPPGDTIQFPKQPVHGGVGGNPWIYAQFLQGNGDPIGDDTLIGRCVQLSKS